MTATFDDIVKQLEVLNKTCSQMAKLLEFSIQKELENALSKIFASPRDRKIYELSNGSRSTRDIGKIIGVDQKVISKLWTKWADINIVESTGKLKPYKAKFTLEELALQSKDRITN